MTKAWCWLRRDTSPAVSAETLDNLIEAGVRLESARAQAVERRGWVQRLKTAREENHLAERMRRAFEDNRSDG